MNISNTFHFLVSVFFNYMMGGAKGNAEGEYLDISSKSSIPISTVFYTFGSVNRVLRGNLCKANISLRCNNFIWTQARDGLHVEFIDLA